MTVFTVTLSGGGPWGLRLIGGHNDPLLIARVRKRSKAEDAGLQENDELVSINGQPCSSITHATAMSTLENSSHLTLEVARAGGHAPTSAVPSLGPAALLPAGGAGSDGGQRTSSVTMQLQKPPASTGLVNGNTNIQSYQTDDGGFHTVKDTSSTEQFGSSTITKVSREVTTNWAPKIDTQGPQGQFSAPPQGASPYQVPSPRQLFSPGGAPPAPYQPPPQNFSSGPPAGPAPYQAPPPHQQFAPAPPQQFAPVPPQGAAPQPVMFKNPTPKTGRPNVWQPGANAAEEPSNGPSLPPPQKPMPSIGPKFNVRNMSNVTTQEAYGSWAPGGKTIPAKVSPRPMTPPRDEPESSAPAIWQPPKATFRDIVDHGPRPQPPPSQMTNGAPNSFGSPNGVPSYGDNISEPDFHYPENRDTLPHVDLDRLMREGSSDGSGMNTPNRKKKIFADSAFYDDPSHKYPTIEEQIKMARKVALSLTSPANKRARGHQMFNKRREKSDRWIAGKGFDVDADIYYNPDPWKNRQGTHTWQPAMSPTPSSYSSHSGPSAPTPMPSNLDRWMAPSYKDYDAKDDKAGALSAEEFERMRLYEQKSLHNTVSPQVCFNLASDLRNAKGRAGQMFAKRRAKADEHVVDESNVKGGPDPKIMAKLLEGKAHTAPPPRKDVRDSKPADMFVKSEVSPWEAALGGNMDTAFSHLNKSPGAWAAATPVPDKFNTPSATKLEQGGGVTPLDCQNFNRRARGWGAVGGGPAAAPPPQPEPQPQAAQWPAAPPQPPPQWPPSSGASAPQWQSGAEAAAPSQQYSAPAQPVGFSDL